MDEVGDLIERRLSREDLLKLAAATGGAGLVAGRAGLARAALAQLQAEQGRLQLLDWPGYGYDGGQAMFAQYVKKYPHNKPKFSVMTNESDALGKLRAGLKADIFRPYVGWVKYFATSGLVQPWDTSLIPNFKHLNPLMVKAGQYGGKQYGIPEDWGFDAILYRADKVKPKARSWGLLFDERYKGKIAWFDDLEMLVMTGFYLGYKDPYNQTDAELKRAQKLLISKKRLVRTIWSSETDMDNLFASGDLWIAYAWPNDWVQMKAKGLKVVYMHPKEKPISWVGMFMLLKGTPRPHLAHAYVDAWSSAKSGKWLEDNYGYGHANTLARPKSSDLLRALQLSNPRAVAEPNAHFDRDIPQRAKYAKLWEEVKAS
jgi:spermidine/putrescine transport system substrate-binding protein